MTNINYSLNILIIMTLFISFFYFLLFAKNKEQYIKYWGLSWVLYSLSLLSVVLFYDNTHTHIILSIRRAFDLFSMLFILMGLYSFTNLRIPTHWIKFSLLNLLWLCITMLYDFQITYILFPIILYQGILAAVAIYLIYKHWKITVLEKIVSILIFGIWGLNKLYYPLFGLEFWSLNNQFINEIIISNVLNFYILIIYLYKIKNELSTTDNHFSTIVENAKDIIFYYDVLPENKFRYISPSVRDILGYDQNEFYSNPFLFEEIADYDSRELFNFFKDIEQQKDNDSLTVKIINKQGVTKWLEFHNVFIKSNDKNIHAIEGIIRDVTRKVTIEQEAANSKKERQLLLSYISHELKTPVTSILGYTSAIQDGTIITENEKSASINVIQSKAKTLQKLIDDLFQLSKLETNNFSFNFMQLSASELFEPIINKYAIDVKSHGINFSSNIDTISEYASVDFIADSSRIDQVFANIVFNSINHTPSNGHISINYAINEKAKEITISIKDTGAGIASKDIAHIFDSFYKGESEYRRNNESTGLGLKISREIIIAHQGEIWAESVLNHGSTFHFTLPFYIEEENLEYN